MGKNRVAAPLVHVLNACDELNNVLTAMLLRTGLLRNSHGDIAELCEIEALSQRARDTVTALRIAVDRTETLEP